jgi:hypothetical protein
MTIARKLALLVLFALLGMVVMTGLVPGFRTQADP